MDQQNQDYIKSQKQWQENQELLIETLKEQLRNSERMVELHQKQVHLSLESLDHEVGALQRGKENFNKWLAENK